MKLTEFFMLYNLSVGCKDEIGKVYKLVILRTSKLILVVISSVKIFT